MVKFWRVFMIISTTSIVSAKLETPENVKIFTYSDHLISKDPFYLVSNLTYLDLKNSKNQPYQGEIFNNFGNSTRLVAWRNNLLKLHSDAFAALMSLKHLVISNNSLTKLPQGIFDKNDQLETIKFSWNVFESLPEKLFKTNKNLRIVDFHDLPKLQTLPSGLLSNLTNLTYAKVNNCGLKSLPANLFEGSTNLREILLHKNDLQSLSEKIFDGLQNLEKLTLNDNQLENIHNKLFLSCISLKELYINNNNIVRISKLTFFGLDCLHKLFIQNNQLKEIDREAFTFLQNVNFINLSHNNLSDTSLADKTSTYTSVFKTCLKLEELDLSYNKISLLFDDWISTPPSLFQYLNLAHNRISFLITNDLDFKHNLNFTLDLSNNDITYIDLHNYENIFNKRKRSKIVINIENNSPKCDCNLYDFLRYLDGSMKQEVKEKLVIKAGSMKCSGPKEYLGTLLSDLNSKDFTCIPPKWEIDNYNDCPDSCDLWKRPSDQMLIFDCTHRNLTEAPKTLCSMKNQNYSKQLDLRNNRIKIFPNLQQIGYKDVTNLLLTWNLISTIHDDAFLDNNLKVVMLDWNRLSSLPEGVLNKILSTPVNVTLGNNPWLCDCDNEDIWWFMTQSNLSIQDVDKIFCENLKIYLKSEAFLQLCPNKMYLFIDIYLGLIALILLVLFLYYLFKYLDVIFPNKK